MESEALSSKKSQKAPSITCPTRKPTTKSISTLLREAGALRTSIKSNNDIMASDTEKASDDLPIALVRRKSTRRTLSIKTVINLPMNESDKVPITNPDELVPALAKEPSLKNELESGCISSASFDSTSTRLIKLTEWKYSRFSNTKKWTFLVLISSAAVLIPLSTNIYYPALIAIEEEFQASTTFVNATITCYILFTGFGPLLWSAVADVKGRRITYIVSLSIFLLTSIATAFSTSIEMLLGLRIAQAIGGSSVLAVGAGSISDLFAPSERGTAMGWYILGPQIGPLIGPLLGGVFTQYTGWRSIFWFLSGYAAIVLAGIVFIMDETLVPLWYNPDIDPKITTRFLLKSSTNKMNNPLATFAFLHYPPILAMIINSCIIYMIAYCLATSLARDYQTIYNFNALAAGLAYAALTFGNLCGTVLAGKLSDKVMENARKGFTETLKESQIASVPEERLKGSLLVSWAVPIGLLIHGWCFATKTFWFFPMIGQFIFGVAQMAPFVIGNTYLVDCFAGHSASIMALNNAMRSIPGSLSALFVTVLKEALGPLGTGYMFTILSMCFMISYSIVFLVWRYGEQSRLRYHRWNHHLLRHGSGEPSPVIHKEEDKVSLTSKVRCPLPTQGVMYYGDGMHATRERVKSGSIVEM